jgi:CRISPR-associated protein Csy1
MDYTGLSEQIANYIKVRAEARLDKFDKEADKQRKAAQDGESLAELKLALAANRQEEELKYRPTNWLADAALRAKQIQMVTHVLKFTHTDAKGSSFYSPGGRPQSENMLNGEVISTASLVSPDIDVVGNAAALDVARLLQVKHNDKALIDCIKQGDLLSLRPFAQDEKQLTEWLESFQQVLTGNELSSHKLAKQIYFPVANGKYHLLSPIFSSSLAHALYGRVEASRSPDAKVARKAKKESKYNNMMVVDYPNTAQQSFGGTKPQNVSLLNSSRHGKSFLLSCAPPHWKVQAKPPLRVKSVFSRNHFGLRVRKETWELQQYLLSQLDKTSVMAVRERRAEHIDELIDQLIQYAAEIQNLTHHVGWSALPECKLSRAEQLWLDPHRALQDDVFAQEYEKNDWQALIADQFARWLNNRIKHEKLTLGDTEHREWKKSVLEVLT